MKTSTKKVLLKSLNNVYDKAKGCELSDEFLIELDNDLTTIATYLKTSKIQALFITVIFVLNYDGSSVEVDNLTKYFNCSPLKIIEHDSDLEQLCECGYLIKKKTRFRNFNKGLPSRVQYIVNETLSQALVKQLPLPIIKEEDINNVLDFLEKWNTLVDERSDDEIEYEELLCECAILMAENSHFPFVENLNKLQLKPLENVTFVQIVWEYLNGDRNLQLNNLCEKIIDKPSKRLQFMQDISEGKNPLISEGLLELDKASFISESEIKLTPKSLGMLSDCGLSCFIKVSKRNNIIEPNKIMARKLLFDEDNTKQLDLLDKLLEDKWLCETQERLTEKKLPKGITVLLYGYPGTGKTESVLQVARKTGREIMKVDISQSKSMWFGESEKIIKRIFTDYRDFSLDCKQMPILLFNEADAILAKRNPSHSSSVSQTENAIQNILLEELENFDGIFMATTNLKENLDKAFDRRFLFKIEFAKPSQNIKAEIWKLKLPFLSNTDCQTLGREFDFSGGQIDNVVRKAEINSIINGNELQIKLIKEFCQQEHAELQQTRIGFY